jgi:Transposase DDE domain
LNKLQKKAIETKFVQRKSPLDGSVFLQALVLNVFQFGVIILDQLAKAAHRIDPDVEVTGQAFKERFNAAAVEFLKAMFVEALNVSAPRAAQVIPLLEAFSEVNLLDSSSVLLPESLKESYPGCGGIGAKAAAKVYLLLNYLTGSYQRIRIEAARKADQNMGEQFLAGHKPGALWMFDLGFFCAPFLAQVAEMGSFYLCRLAASQLNFFCRNGAGELEPFDLDRFLRRAPRELFEIEVVFGPRLEVVTRLVIAPVPAAVAAERRRKTRLAASKQGRTPTQRTLNRCSWTLLLTNASPEQLPTTTALVVYGVRWQVELSFKLFKSDAKLETSLGSEEHRVECEFYAKLITLLFFNRISGLVENFAGEKISPAKLWRRMRDEASDLLRGFGKGTAQSLRELLQFLSRYARPRSGKKYPSTLQRLERAAKEARQVIFKDPLGCARERRKTIAESKKTFAHSLESYEVKLNSEKLSDQRTVSLP